MNLIRLAGLIVFVAALAALGSGCVAGGTGTTLFNGSTTVTLDQKR